MDLVITIDTEEDNWSNKSATHNPTRNIRKLIPLQNLFDEYAVRPTYLITYPVATDPQSVEILKSFHDAGKCEIGMHCHPWNTPPLVEHSEIQKRNTMLCNLPYEIVFEKLSHLSRTIYQNCDVTPTSFRAGRWAFGPAVALALDRLNYRVDSSVSPYIDWRQNSGPDFSTFTPHPFRFGADGVECENKKGPLLEVPATVGFLQKNFQLCQRIIEATENPLAKTLRLKGTLDRLKLVNKYWLSPELTGAVEMVKLGHRMEKNGYSCINMTFHSNSLLPGCSPFVRTVKDEKLFMEKITFFLEESQKQNWLSKTLSELTM